MRKQKGGDIPTTLAIGATTGAIGIAAQAAQQATVDPVTQVVGYLSSNPWLAGVCYVILNLGGKHIAMNLTPEQEKLMGSVWIRPIIIFCLCFVATRNVVTAFWLTFFFMLVFYVILYEASPLCLLRVVPTQATVTKEEKKTQSIQNPNGQIQMIPLFMRGPLAVPDTTVVSEEATYLSNIAKL
jgi:hypothetical protein